MSALFTEIFPLTDAAQTRLYAYIPQYKTDSPPSGGKLAYRLRRALGGHWTWLHGRLVTEMQPNPVKIIMALDQIKEAAPKLFGSLELLAEDVNWEPDAETTAEFLIRGPLDALGPTIQEALDKVSFPIKNVRVERTCRPRAWVVDGSPAVSLSIVTRLLYTIPIDTYVGTLEKQTDLVGLHVADRTSTLQGEIVKLVGDLAAHRERLVALSQRQVMRDLLQTAPDDALVVRVESKGEHYDYAGPALELVLTLDTAKRYDVIADQVERAYHINPALRAQLVKAASDIAKNAGLLQSAYSEQNATDRFTLLQPRPSIVWAGSKARPYEYDQSALAVDFTRLGAYAKPQDPLRVVALNALGDDGELYLEALGRELTRTHKVTMQVARSRKLNVVSEQNIDSGVRAVAKEGADVLIAFFPDEQELVDELPRHDRYLKMQAVARGLPTLIVHFGTMNRVEATPSLLMGLLARAGGAAFAFEEPLPYADRILGLSMKRIAKKDGEHLHVLARYYTNRGISQGWRAAQALVKPGAPLPAEILNTLLPHGEITMKRTLIHVPDALYPADRETLMAWQDEHDAALYLVEIAQRGAPRLYNFAGNKVEVPPRGSAFVINEREALLTTSSAPFNATPYPLHVCSYADIKLAHILDSIMSLTLLHQGALQVPKLPVTISSVEEWADGVERGIFPDARSGRHQWWL